MDGDGIGFSEAAEDANALKDVLDDLERRSHAFGAALTGALASATRGGKGLEDVLRGAGLRLTEIALSAGLKPLEGLLGSAISGLAGSLSGATAFANGGVPGRVTPFCRRRRRLRADLFSDGWTDGAAGRGRIGGDPALEARLRRLAGRGIFRRRRGDEYRLQRDGAGCAELSKIRGTDCGNADAHGGPRTAGDVRGKGRSGALGW